MNIEFLLLIGDYFRVIKKRDFLSDWTVPFLLSLLYFYFNINNCKIADTLKSLADHSISLLGVLVGFSIAVITLLITANTENIKLIKGARAGQINQYRPVSLFDLMIITYTYSVVMEIFLIIFNLFLPSLQILEGSYTLYANIIGTIDVLLIMHILFVTIRNITNFYFILIKK